MRIAVEQFKGQAPIFAHRLLPQGMASSAVNARLVSGDLDSYADVGAPFQLAKSPLISTIWRMAGQWLHWNALEAPGGVEVSLGTIPGDASGRAFVTGLSGGSRQTNLFYATDPSQQGGGAAGAFPYVSFPLGIAAPLTAPTATAPSAPQGPTTTYSYAAEASVNNAVVAAGGSGYRVGDVLTVAGGSISPGLAGAQIKVKAVGAGGAVSDIELLASGNYANGGGPPASNAAVSGGSGSGATFNLTVVGNSFDGFGTFSADNGAGYYVHWNINGGKTWSVASGQGDLTVAYAQTTFGLKSAAGFTFQADMQTDDNGGGEFTDLVMYLCGTYGGGAAINGPAVILSKSDGSFALYSSFSGSNGSSVSGTIVAQNSLAVTGGAMYRVMAVCRAQTSSTTPGYSVKITLALQSSPNTIVSTLSGFIPYVGESLGVGSNHRGDHNHGNDAEFENLIVSVSQPAQQATAESTSYVYTYVTQYGSGDNQIMQESAPSDPSQTVTFFLDGSTHPVTMTPVSVSIPPAPAGRDIANYRLYRLVRGADGSETYQYVQQFAADTAAAVSFSDALLDSALGNPLLSADWQAPPANLRGILALPNGIMAGFFANTLCLSARNYPFAWPVTNQLPTDTAIVAIAAIDATVLVLTQAHPYTAWGSDPSAYSMSKETANQGCVSRRSAATHKRLGVIYASGNGLCYYRGQGELDLIRMPGGDPYFSVEQWQALNPSSILGVVHDDRYWFWFTTGFGAKGGYVLDLSPAGFGLVALDFHVTAAYVDPASDTLYFVPDYSVHPINGAAVTAALNVVSAWEGGNGKRPRTWGRNGFLLPRPACFGMARVRAEDYGDVHLTVACENGIAYDEAVSGPQPFVMTPVVGVRWRLALSGSSTVNTVELVETVEELGP